MTLSKGREEALTLPGFNPPEAVFLPTVLLSEISFSLEASSAFRSRKELAPTPAAFALLVVDLGAIQAPFWGGCYPIRKSRRRRKRKFAIALRLSIHFL